MDRSQFHLTTITDKRYRESHKELGFGDSFPPEDRLIAGFDTSPQYNSFQELSRDIPLDLSELTFLHVLDIDSFKESRRRLERARNQGRELELRTDIMYEADRRGILVVNYNGFGESETFYFKRLYRVLRGLKRTIRLDQPRIICARLDIPKDLVLNGTYSFSEELREYLIKDNRSNLVALNIEKPRPIIHCKL